MCKNIQEIRGVVYPTNLIWGGSIVHITVLPLAFRVSVPVVLLRWAPAFVAMRLFA